jgi:YD repeat-containing protein
VNPLGNRNTTQYDARGLVEVQVDALGARTSFVYDAAGQQTAVVDANGNRSTSDYDAIGQIGASVSALGYRASIISNCDGGSSRIRHIEALYAIALLADNFAVHHVVSDLHRSRVPSGAFEAQLRTRGSCQPASREAASASCM